MLRSLTASQQIDSNAKLFRRNKKSKWFFCKLVRTNDFDESAVTPFSIMGSNKQEEVRSNRTFVFGDRGLVNIAKEPPLFETLLQWARASREIRRSGFGLRGHAKKEGTGSTTKASEMKIGERGRKEGRKKPGPKGARARERNAWELNHVVGRLAREISRCESAHTHTETIHVHELPVHVEAAANKTSARIYYVSRSRGISERITRGIIRPPFME